MKLTTITGAGAFDWRELAERTPIVSRCANCDGFAVDLPLRDARDAFRVHVAEAHPELLPMFDVKRLRQRDKPATSRDEFGILTRLAEIAA